MEGEWREERAEGERGGRERVEGGRGWQRRIEGGYERKCGMKRWR